MAESRPSATSSPELEPDFETGTQASLEAVPELDDDRKADSDADLEEAVAELIGLTQIQDVQLARLNIEVVADLPDEVNVLVSSPEVSVRGVLGDKKRRRLQVELSNRVLITAPDSEEIAARIEFSHRVQFAYKSKTKPRQDVVEAWVTSVVLFMVFPYVRATLHDACLRTGIPPVVLGYLERGEAMPEGLTVVLNTTKVVGVTDNEE